MSSGNWYESDHYLQNIYESTPQGLAAFPHTWNELYDWLRYIDNTIPSNSLILLLKQIKPEDVITKNHVKNYLSEKRILPKRDFENLWKHTHPLKPITSSIVKEPTVKEIVDITANQILDDFDIVTLKESDQIMIKNSVHYSLEISELETAIIKGVEPYSKGNYDSYLKNILLKIRKLTFISQEDFYTDPWVIVFQNGLYDTLTDVFYLQDDPKIKDLKFFYAIPHDYIDEHFDCPAFRKACFDWFSYPKCGFSDILMSDIFETIGYCMTMNNSLKTAFMNYGPPDTGKTQLLNIMMRIIGKNNYSMTGIKRMTKNEFGTSWLQFKIFNAAGETPKKKLYDTDVFKNATGGDDEIPGEVKGGKRFKFTPYAKHCFNANYIPPIDNPNDSAFFNRFVLYPFRNIFKQKKSTRDFFEDIVNNSSEIQGIIHNAIKGLHRLHRRNGFRLKLKENTRHVWLYESDDVYKFLHDHCIRNKNERILSEELWEYYNDVASLSLTKQKLTIELQKHKINKKQVRAPTSEKPNKRVEMYIGVSLKEINEPQEKDLEGDIGVLYDKIELEEEEDNLDQFLEAAMEKTKKEYEEENL